MIKCKFDATFAYLLAGLAGGAIAGIAIGVVAGVLLLAACIYFGCYRKKKMEEAKLLSAASEEFYSQNGQGIYILFSLSFLTLQILVNE